MRTHLFNGISDSFSLQFINTCMWTFATSLSTCYNKYFKKPLIVKIATDNHVDMFDMFNINCIITSKLNITSCNIYLLQLLNLIEILVLLKHVKYIIYGQVVMCADSRVEGCGFKPRVWPQLENFPCSPSSKWVPVGTNVYNTGIIINSYSVKRFETERW